MRNIDITTIRFPAIQLERRDAHKLRGFFGNRFRDIPELHNHLEGDTYRHAYPVVQYKVLNGVPTLVGVGEGSRVLQKLVDKVEYFNIDDRILPVTEREVLTRSVSVGVDDKLHTYCFDSMWMALNARNHARYCAAGITKQIEILRSILVGNILVFLGACNEIADREIIAQPQVAACTTSFKNIKMMAFQGSFKTNVVLPDGIGLGKSASRGFGAIRGAEEVRGTRSGALRPRFTSVLPKYRRRVLAG